jgi:hypothetical protein
MNLEEVNETTKEAFFQKKEECWNCFQTYLFLSNITTARTIAMIIAIAAAAMP